MTPKVRHADRSNAPFYWILAAAVLFRLVYLWQSRQSPFFEPSVLDTKYYHEWALRVSKGIFDAGVFHGLPLYPYALGLLYKLTGASLQAAKIAQLALGVGTVWLVGRTTEKLMDRRAAIAAMALAALYAPMVFHEGLLIAESLGMFLYALAFFGCILLFQGPSRRRAAWVGAAAGLAALTKAGILLFVVLYAFYFARRAFSPKKWTVLAVFIGFFLGALLPVTAHNWIRGKDRVWLTSHAGFNFYIGNHPGAEGVFSAPEGTGSNIEAQREDSRVIAETQMGRPLKPSEVSAFWSRKAWTFIRTHPAEFLALSARKLALFFDAREISDIEDFQFERQFVPLLTFPWPSFLWLGPLFLAGALLSWRTMKYRSLYSLWILSYLLGMIAFFVNARYRLPLLPALFSGAGFAMVTYYDALMGRKVSPRLIWGLVAAVLGIAVGQMRLVETNFVRNYLNAADAFAERRQIRRAEEFYREAVSRDPSYAKAHLGLAVLLTKTGRPDEAKEAYEKSLEADPNNSQAWNNLGMWYERSGDLGRAQEYFEKALALKPSSSQAHNNLGMVLAKRGRPDEAVRHFEASLKINPDSPRANTNLGVLVYTAGDKKRAKALWQKALSIDPGFEDARKALAAFDSFDSSSRADYNGGSF